jgi:hypothetical protein
MTKEQLQDATIIVLLADGTFKLFDYAHTPQLRSTINEPEMEIKCEPAIAAKVQKPQEKYSPIFIQTEDGILTRSKKHGLVNIEDWDSLHFDGALQGHARYCLKRQDLNEGDLNIIHDILTGRLPR